jgi:DNA polymerase-3 subunit delta'
VSAAESDDDKPAHPRDRYELIGHADAERAMLDAYRSGRMPHA